MPSLCLNAACNFLPVVDAVELWGDNLTMVTIFYIVEWRVGGKSFLVQTPNRQDRVRICIFINALTRHLEPLNY